MDRYLDALEKLGRGHADAWKQIARDREVIENAQAFDQDFYLPPAAKASAERTPLLHYLVRSHILHNKSDPIAANYLRRPCVGFHPADLRERKPRLRPDNERRPVRPFSTDE